MAATGRGRRLVLAALILVAAARALFWVVLTEVPSPIDEVQHVAYIDSLATTFHPPVVGRDEIPPGMAALAKRSPTFAMRSRPVPADPTDPRWGPVGASYEGGQTPLGYAPFVPVWWAVRGLAPRIGLLALRLTAAALALLPIPLLLLAGRRLFPDVADVGLVAAGLYVLAPSVWIHTVLPAGDTLVPTAGALALLAVASVVDRHADARSAWYLGLAAAGLLLVKPTTLGMVPVVMLVGVVAAWRLLDVRRLAGWLARAAAGLVLPLVPWVAWNLLAYGAPSAAAANDAILGGAQFDVPFGWEALKLHTRTALEGIFAVPRAVVAWDRYELIWLSLLVVAGIAGAVAAWRRRQTRRAVTIPLLTLALPATFAGMLVVIFVVFGARSSVVGRHLIVAVPAACLAIAAGATTVAGRRIGLAALLLVGGLLLLPREAQLTERFVAITYLEHAPPTAALDVQRDLAVRAAPIVDVAVDAPCPVRDVDVVVDQADPFPLTTRGGVTLVPERITSVLRPAWLRYRLPTPRADVRLSVPESAGAPNVPVTRDGRAAVRAWCPDDDARADTFAAMHAPLHPIPLPYPVVTAYVWVLRWAAPAAAVGGALVLLAAAGRERRSTADSPET